MRTLRGDLGRRTSPGGILRVVTLASRTGRYGGPFDTATRQAQALRFSGLPARVLAGAFPGDRPDPDALAPGRYVRVRNLLRIRGFLSTFSLRVAIAVVQEVQLARTVHISFARELIPIWCALVTLALGRRLVLQPHGMLTSRTSAGHRILDRICVRPLFRRSSAVIALSETEARDLAAWSGGATPPIHILGNPLPPRVPVPPAARVLPEADAIRLVFIARLHPRKRVADFVAAADAARAAGRPWRWTVVGPDDGDGALVQRAAEDNAVLDYLGAVSADSVVDQLNSATLFVMPSEREPWGNVLATAIALGIPSIVTRSAALAPQVAAYGAGRVVPDRDPEALLAAAEDLTSGERYSEASSGALRLRRDLLDPEVLRRALVEAVSGAHD